MTSFKRKMVVHVVDDNAGIREVLTRALRLEGYLVRAMENGEQLEEAFTHEKPDLILIDVMLPLMPGYQVLERLDRRGQLEGVRVMMMSGLPRERLRPPGRFADVPFMCKPFDLFELRRAVAAQLPEPRRSSPVQAVIAAQAPPQPAREHARPATASGRLTLLALERALGTGS